MTGTIISHNTHAKAVSADYVCNPDFNVAQLGIVMKWTPAVR